jgi:hypothetical protein
VCSTTLCITLGEILENVQWCGNAPQLVETSYTGKVTTLWNQQVKIDRNIPNNKLDVIIHTNKKKGTYIYVQIHRSIIRTSRTECGIRMERTELPHAIRSKQYITKLHKRRKT